MIGHKVWSGTSHVHVDGLKDEPTVGIMKSDPMRESHSRTALLAVMVLALAAFVPPWPNPAMPRGSPTLYLQIHAQVTMTSENFGAVKYIV